MNLLTLSPNTVEDAFKTSFMIVSHDSNKCVSCDSNEAERQIG